MLKKYQKGFTLVELLVVISIIGILATTVILSLNRARAKARDVKRLTDMRQMKTALELYFNDNNSWPTSAGSGTQSSCLGPSSENCWLGNAAGLDSLVTDLQPYMTRLPKNNANSGTRAYDYMLYLSNASAGDIAPGSPAGAYLTWIQETGMTSAKCPSNIISNYNDGYLYCYEYLGP